MIKVLEVIRQGQIGGGESHLLDLIYFLNKEKIIPVCLSFTDGEMINRLTQMGVICYVLETQRPFDTRIQKKIIQIIKDEEIQLIHAHGSRAASNILFPSWKLKLPIIYTVHGWSFHDDQSFLIKKCRSLSEKIICARASHVICVSQSNKVTGEKVFGLKNATVIENGINLDRFNPNIPHNDLRKRFGYNPSDFVVGFIARCTKQKNPLLFLESLAKAHEANSLVKGLFIGEGDMDMEVDEFIKVHQMEQYLYRSMFRTDVPDVLHTIDVYCLPSLWEGLSIALLEAMAMKKPIIATPTDGTRELIQNGENGIVKEYDNSNDAFIFEGKYSNGKWVEGYYKDYDDNGNLFLKEIIQKNKKLVKEKNMIIMVIYYLKENI